MIKERTVAIVMPVHNVWNYTAQCIKSILDTKTPFDSFIVINNASTGGTIEKMRDIQLGDNRFRTINNRINRGVSSAWNQGIRATNCEFICIMNNDIVVREGWLDELVKASIENDKKVLIPQYTSGLLPDTFPEPPKEEIKPGWTGKLEEGVREGVHFQGFCFLVNKLVFREVGYFDEQFEMWWYEDSDFLDRLVQTADVLGNESFKPTMALNSYIHHFGSKTLEKIPEDLKMHHINLNRQRYEKKHPKKN